MTTLPSLFLPVALFLSATLGGGFLGVRLTDNGGPTVSAVIENTAAARAGIQVGDRFVAVNGTKTPSVDAFLQVMRKLDAGQKVRFDVHRGQHDLTMNIVLGKRPDAEEEEEEETIEEKPVLENTEVRPPAERAEVAAPVQEKAAAGGAYLGVSVVEDDEKLVVEEVVKGGPADHAGIRAGDVLTAVGRTRELEDIEDLVGALAKLSPGQTARVRVRRGGELESLSVVLGRRDREVREIAEKARAEQRTTRSNADRARDRARATIERARVREKAAVERAKAAAERAKAAAKAAAERAKAAAKAAAERAKAAAERTRAAAVHNAERARAEAERARAEAERARAEAERHAARTTSRSSGREEHEHGGDLDELRQELRDLRKEIHELKELVQKLSRR